MENPGRGQKENERIKARLFKESREKSLLRSVTIWKKRIHWIRKKESEGAHLKHDSVMDDDSKEAIEEYKTKCGHWNH